MDSINNTIARAHVKSTHSIIWKNERFPFNMPLFNIFTNYFTIHQDQIQQDHTINLVENENVEYSKDSIQSFVDFCQCQEINITQDNIIHLYYLSKEYCVTDLKENVDQYILEHQQDNIFLYLQTNDNEKKLQCEERISQNLSDYIDNDKFKVLPINVIHRILSKAKNIEQEKIENFLIEYLSQNGFKASVLFDVIDIEKTSSWFINKLITEFPNDFDFHFINPLFLKTVYIQQNELIKQSEIMRKQQEEKLQQISEEKRQIFEKVEMMSNEIENLKRSLIQKNEEIDQIKKLPPYLFFKYGGNKKQAFCGIINYLTIFCGSIQSDDDEIVKVESSSLYNNNYSLYTVVNFNEKKTFATKGSNYEWLKYDFINRKVRPTHYSIRSRSDANDWHPKSWVIEGSNTGNDNDWKELDKREGETCLKGVYIEHTFDIQNELNINESFRFLRIRIIEDTYGTKYLVFSALEYFGYLY